MAGVKVFDFIKLSTSLPKSVRTDFGALRSKFESSRASLIALPSALESIDWSFYAGKVGNPATVEEFKAKYAAVQVPKPADETSAGIGAQEAEFKVEMKAYLEEASKRIASFEGSLAALRSEKPLAEMTVDEYLAGKPELRAKIEADIESRAL